MNKINLYVGLNDKDTKQQKIDSLEAVKIVTNICTKFADGCTIYNATGIYTHENGTIVIENTLKIELFEVSEDAIKNIANAIKITLNQESIILQREIVNSEMI